MAHCLKQCLRRPVIVDSYDLSARSKTTGTDWRALGVVTEYFIDKGHKVIIVVPEDSQFAAGDSESRAVIEEFFELLDSYKLILPVPPSQDPDPYILSLSDEHGGVILSNKSFETYRADGDYDIILDKMLLKYSLSKQRFMPNPRPCGKALEKFLCCCVEDMSYYSVQKEQLSSSDLSKLSDQLKKLLPLIRDSAAPTFQECDGTSTDEQDNRKKKSDETVSAPESSVEHQQRCSGKIGTPDPDNSGQAQGPPAIREPSEIRNRNGTRSTEQFEGGTGYPRDLEGLQSRISDSTIENVAEFQGFFEGEVLFSESVARQHIGNFLQQVMQSREAARRLYEQAGSHMQGYQQKLLTFMQCADNFANMTQEDSLQNNESIIYQMLREAEMSPLNSQKLERWLSFREQELSFLSDIMESLNGFTYFHNNSQPFEVFLQGLHQKEIFTQKEAALVLFFSYNSSELFLSDLKSYLTPQKQRKTSFLVTESGSDFWFQDYQHCEEMYKTAVLFKQVASATSKPVGFCVMEMPSAEVSFEIRLSRPGTKSISFTPPSQPDAPQMVDVSANSVTLTWKPSECGSENVKSYEVFMKSGDREEFFLATSVHCNNTHHSVQEEAHTCTVEGLEASSGYGFKVVAQSEIGESPESESLWCLTSPPPKKRLADVMKEQSTVLRPAANGRPEVLQLPTRKEHENKENKLRHVFIGQGRCIRTTEEKVIMLMGATGTGKTTLINAMANYFYEVCWEDDFRFVAVKEDEKKSQAHSQTKWITAYHFEPWEGSPVPYRLIVVDTPGFNDTAGVHEDRKTIENIRLFFSSKGPSGIPHLNIVGFLVQSPMARLTAGQRFVFESIFSIFGKNVANSIHLLLTFADSQDPPALAAVKEANIECCAQYTFNNTGLFAANAVQNVVIGPNFDKMFWDMGTTSMQNFFDSFRNAPAVSLDMTIENLNERKRLAEAVRNLRPQVDNGLFILEQIKKHIELIKRHEKDIEEGKDFEFIEEVAAVRKVSIAGTGKFTTYCQACNFTCHRECTLPDGEKNYCVTVGPDYGAIVNELKEMGVYDGDADDFTDYNHYCNGGWKEGEHNVCSCWLEDTDEKRRNAHNVVLQNEGRLYLKHFYCTVCPRTCHYEKHINADFIRDHYVKQERRTHQSLKDLYDKGVQGKSLAEGMLDEAKKKFEHIRNQTIILLCQVHTSLKKIDELAQRHNPSTIVDYMEQLIEAENLEKKPGWQARIKSLQDYKQDAELIDKIKTHKFRPFDQYEDALKGFIDQESLALSEQFQEEEQKKGKKGYAIVRFLKGTFGHD